MSEYIQRWMHEENKVISLHYMYQYSSNNLYWYSTPVELVHFERKKPLRNSYILIVLLNEYLYHLTINSSCAVTVDNFLFAKVHLMLSFFVFYGKIVFMIHVPCFSQIKSN